MTFLLFVAIAFFFWTVQTAREETASEFIVKFYVEDQPQDMVFTTHVPSELKVTLSDTYARLSNYRRRERVASLSVNFERYADAIGNFRISAAELQSLLRTNIESSTNIVAVTPSLIDARFAQTEGRKYPVRLSGNYLPAANHRVHASTITPDSVIINAPASVLDTLRYVYGADEGQTGMTDTLLMDLRLDLPIGVKATPSEVKVVIPVAEYVEKTLEQVEVRTLREPQNRHLVVFPYAVKVSCLVDFAHYRDITADDFVVSVNYDSIRGQEARGTLPISVSYVGPPEIVSQIDYSPQTAEYVIEKR